MPYFSMFFCGEPSSNIWNYFAFPICKKCFQLFKLDPLKVCAIKTWNRSGSSTEVSSDRIHDSKYKHKPSHYPQVNLANSYVNQPKISA